MYILIICTNNIVDQEEKTMAKDITVVTAFFNINRDEGGDFKRSEEKYFEYFTLWAKIQNRIIVYVESEKMKEKIINFRASIGLKENTIVVLVDDCLSIDKELYTSIKTATENSIQKKYRLYKDNPEVWNAAYDYIMLMKMWCVKNAIEKGLASGQVAWVDFGYNHGGSVISKESDFNFMWKYDFPEKINLFLVQDLDDRPIFDIVFNMDTYIMGMCIVGIDYLWTEFWKLMRKNMMSLNSCGLTDDDQNVILMCYRERPDIFNTYKSDWHITMKQFGGDHLILVDNKKNDSLLKDYLRKLKNNMQCKQYTNGIYNYIKKLRTH